MMRFIRGWRSVAVVSLLLALPAAAACTQAATGTGSDNLEGSELEILFPKMYSAFDGEHDFKIPAMVVGVKNVKWSADPASAVELEKQTDGSVLITVKEAGDVTITAKAGNLKASAPLTITQATSAEWTEGKERYNNGVVFKRPDRDGGGGGGGGGRGDGGARGDRVVDKSLACTNCHARGGKGSDVEHTPMQTAGYTDDELVTIFSEGKKPDGVKMRTTTKEKWQKMHQWTMEPEEKKGIVVYLRSLEPEAQGEIDFGGRGGGGKGKRDDDGETDGGAR